MTDNPRSPWQQLTYTCDDWRAAEHTAVAVLGPLLATAQDKGDIASWWFIRKGPEWRVRLESPAASLTCRLAEALAGDGDARAVTEGTYEPETTRFGGPDAMDAAHRLFAADSRHLLDHLTGNSPRLLREIPVILASRLLRAARQDWYEQGDCWEQMAAHRSDGHDPAPEPDAGTVSAMLALLSAGGDAPGSPLRDRPEWASAFEDAGRRIAALAGRGLLARGQRAVLAQHLLFLFNRHGVSASGQHLLAAAACQAVFGSQPTAGTPLNPGGPPRSTTTVSAVTTTTGSTDENRAAQLRNQLADWISGRGTFQTPGVEQAFRTVSRHEFLPGHPLEDAYSRKPVVTQRAPDGSSTSSASSPNLVAQMLEQLQAEPGNTVLEIGAATGFNAALLASLTCPGGKVVTIEYDPGLAGQAAANLRRAGYPQVQVIADDGALGHREQGPYDRIIVTAEATDITAAWWDQLNPADGRIVIPVRLHGSGLTRSLGLRRTGPRTMVADSAYVCGFVAMRGSGERAGQQIRLDSGAALKVDAADQPDAAALSRVLYGQPDQRWTGIRVRDDEPAAHLDLWLLTMIAQGHGAGASFGRLSVTPDARSSGLADPALRWAGAGLYHGGTLAWIIARQAGDGTRELGIDARGPGAPALAGTALSLLAEWDARRPAEPVITATRVPAEPGAAPGAVRVARPVTTFTIAW
jgi:protein-L-isoaspartate(D-aspartate) O-methyltransferase